MIPTGDRKGEKVYTVCPVSYGLLTTDEVAKQISTECTATPADVKAVLDRYAYYVKENLRKGYDVELLGFGTLTIRFMISHSVDSIKKATGKIVDSLLPAFRPSYTMHNGTRIYNLIPEKVALVKYGEEAIPDINETPGDPGTSDGGDETPVDPGISDGEDTGSGSGSEDTGSDSGSTGGESGGSDPDFE